MKDLLETHRLTSAQLAEDIGMSQQTFSKRLNGTNNRGYPMRFTDAQSAAILDALEARADAMKAAVDAKRAELGIAGKSPYLIDNLT